METNRLVHVISVNNDVVNCKVVVKLADDCKNGHEDFSVTGGFWELHMPRIDRYMITGGCCHEEIEKHFPELKKFIDLHLCDFTGSPMHSTSNMLYFLREGFNSVKPTEKGFKKQFCDYYRITSNVYDKIKNCEDKTQLAIMLGELDVLKRWGKQAKAAIKELETLTGQKFVSKATRSVFVAPSAEEVDEYKAKVTLGYYTPEAKQKRDDEKVKSYFDSLESDRLRSIAKINLEYQVKTALLTAGGKRALDNAIFYTHTNKVKFNWRNWDELPQTEIDEIKSKCILPIGVCFE